MGEFYPQNKKQESDIENYGAPANINAELVSAFTLKAAELRRKVFPKLRTFYADDITNKWLYFLLPSKAEPGQTQEYNLNRKILLYIQESRDQKPPTIRILSNELFGTVEDGQVFSEDFILDGDDDAQYFIDAAVTKNNRIQPGTNSVIFYPQKGELMLWNVRLFPPACKFQGIESDIYSYPLGHYKNTYDKFDALEFGSSMFNEIRQLTPHSWR